MQRVCVFCGSNSGRNGAYIAAARELGTILADNGVGVVYGGAAVGLMGAVADAALEAGGEVIGVLPGFLEEKELAHPNLTQLVIVDSMHERKAKMADLADGFIALPGGMGTLEEFFEVLTWGQLGLHHKPCGLLDIDDFYTPLTEFVGKLAREQFIRDAHKDMVLSEKSPDRLLAAMREFRPVTVEKWIDRERT